MKISIYTITHKPQNSPLKLPDYHYLHVGNAPTTLKCCDNTGDNISAKNPNFSELTALYWIWKNDQKSEIIGISHYRRFFALNLFDAARKKPIPSEKVCSLLEKYSIIAPIPISTHQKTVLEQYNNTHFAKDLLLCGEIIKKLHPDYYPAFQKVIKMHQYSAYNMFICRRELYDEYLSWLFSILFEAEKQIDLSNYSYYNRRVFGFLSERLFNVWLVKNAESSGFRIKYLPVFNRDDKNPFKLLHHHLRDHFEAKKYKENNYV